ncbi:hypothetical protein B0G80_4789 [Paraburkholderia sp. BL6669N2]|nr:hypothetical protein [Paraburkholderia sp. BL6669N2]REG48549.1 hypothetical protein B0G80_4789 [Paraburkholderia sp. BL6669N2]
MKSTNERSLRGQVEKWLAPAPTMHVRVTRFSRAAGNGRRYVRVEMSSPAGARALFFFRQDDGRWSVFPPTANRRKSTAAHLLVQVAAAIP